MDKRKVGDITFYFKKESVVMRYRGDQYIGFHSFNTYNKQHFYNFTADLRKLRKVDLNKTFEIARVYKVQSTVTTAASIKPLPAKVLPAAPNRDKDSRIMW